MADPLSIAASCIAVITAAAQTTKLIRQFVRSCRAARGDLVRLHQEVSELDLVLHSIQDVGDEGRFDAAAIPIPMQEQLGGLISNCDRVLTEIRSVLTEHSNNWVEARWALSGKKRINEQVAFLEGHRKALDLSLTTIDFSLSCRIKADTSAILSGTDANRETLEEILQLVKQLPASTGNSGNDLGQPEAGAVEGKLDLMRQYLNNLGTYASSVYDTYSEPERVHSFPISGMDARSGDHGSERVSVRDTNSGPTTPQRLRPRIASFSSLGTALDTDAGSEHSPSEQVESLRAEVSGPTTPPLYLSDVENRPRQIPKIKVPLQEPSQIFTNKQISALAVSRDGKKLACSMQHMVFILDASNSDDWVLFKSFQLRPSSRATSFLHKVMSSSTGSHVEAKTRKISFIGRDRDEAFLAIETVYQNKIQLEIRNWQTAKTTAVLSLPHSSETPMAWAASHLQILYDETSNGMQGGSVYFAWRMDNEGLVAHVKHLRDPRTGELASQPFERRTSMEEIESLKVPVPARAKDEGCIVIPNITISGDGWIVYVATIYINEGHFYTLRCNKRRGSLQDGWEFFIGGSNHGGESSKSPLHLGPFVSNYDGSKLITMWRQQNTRQKQYAEEWNIEIWLWEAEKQGRSYFRSLGRGDFTCFFAASPNCELLAQGNRRENKAYLFRLVLEDRADPPVGIANPKPARGEVVLQLINTLELPGSNSICQLEFSPDSSTLFAGSSDGAVCGWDIRWNPSTQGS